MSIPPRNRKRVMPATVVRLIRHYITCCDHGYPPPIAKQYAVHRVERESQGGRGLDGRNYYQLARGRYKYRLTRNPEFDLPRPEGARKCIWERPWEEHHNPNADPRLFDRLVKTLLSSAFVGMTHDWCPPLHHRRMNLQSNEIEVFPEEALPFLLQIRDHPGDLGPLACFADWLEERGDPRGAWVRGLLPEPPLALEEQRCLEKSPAPTPRSRRRRKSAVT